MLKRLILAVTMLAAFGAFGLATTRQVQAQAFYGTNWVGEYFANPSFTPTAAFTQTDPQINFNYGAIGPVNASAPTFPTDNFSIRWTGTQAIPAAGNYQFTVVREDDVRVTVNGVVLINFQNQDINGASPVSNTIALPAGNANIVVEYIARTGNASIVFYYQLLSTTQPGQTQIPGIFFTPTASVTASRTPLPAIPPGAITATVIKAAVLNTRDAPSTGGRKLGQILRGETYAVIGRDADARWFLLQLGGYQAWSYGFYLYINGNEFTPPITSPFGTLGVPGGYADTGVLAQSQATLVLRDIPSVGGRQIGRVTWGAFLPVVGRTGDNFWYQVAWKGTIGWVYSPFTEIIQGDLNAAPVR